MTGRRTCTLSVRVSGLELATLRRRAGAHHLSVAAYVRAVALYDDSRAAARDADSWWAGLSHARRVSVHQWLTEDRTAGVAFPGQLPMPEQVQP